MTSTDCLLSDGLSFSFPPNSLFILMGACKIRRAQFLTGAQTHVFPRILLHILTVFQRLIIWHLRQVHVANLGKLVENNSSKTTRRKQLVENTRRKTRRKATRRKFSGGKLVARIENNLRQI